MKTLQTIAAATILAASTAVSADWDMPFFGNNNSNNNGWDMPFFGNNNSNNNNWDMPFFGNNSNNGFGDMMNDMTGNMDMEMKFKMKAKGNGRGNGNANNYWSNTNSMYNGNNGYAPYGYQPQYSNTSTTAQ